MAHPGFPIRGRQPLARERKPIITARKRSLGQDYVFTGVCLSTRVGRFPTCITGHMSRGVLHLGEVCIQGWSASGGGSTSRGSASRGCASTGVCIQGVCIGGCLHPGGGVWAEPPDADPPQIHGVRRDAVNKRAVVVLLECILI